MAYFLLLLTPLLFAIQTTPDFTQATLENVELVDGKIQLKQQDNKHPDAIFHINFNENEDGVYGAGSSLDCSISEGTISGGYADLTDYGPYIQCPGSGNAHLKNEGTISIHFRPNTTGTPGEHQYMAGAGNGSGDAWRWRILHRKDNGRLDFALFDGNANFILHTNQSGYEFNPTANTTYHIEVNFWESLGDIYAMIFVDGTQVGTTKIAAGDRSSASDPVVMRFAEPDSVTPLGVSDMSIDEITIYNKVQHKANFTSSKHPEIYPGYHTSGKATFSELVVTKDFDDFGALMSAPTDTEIKFSVRQNDASSTYTHSALKSAADTLVSSLTVIEVTAELTTTDQEKTPVLEKVVLEHK